MVVMVREGSQIAMTLHRKVSDRKRILLWDHGDPVSTDPDTILLKARPSAILAVRWEKHHGRNTRVQM